MSMVPALAEAQAARIERMKRMGAYCTNVVPALRVRPAEPEVVTAPAVKLPVVPEGRDWLNIGTPNLNPVSTKITIAVVASAYSVSQMEIVSRRRNAEVFMPRAVVCWILRTHAVLSLPQIGIRIGGRDHTTVRSAIFRVDEMRRREPALAERIDALVEIIRSKDDRWKAAA